MEGIKRGGDRPSWRCSVAEQAWRELSVAAIGPASGAVDQKNYLAEENPKDFWKGPRGRMSRQREAAPPGNYQSSVVRVQAMWLPFPKQNRLISLGALSSVVA